MRGISLFDPFKVTNFTEKSNEQNMFNTAFFLKNLHIGWNELTRIIKKRNIIMTKGNLLQYI